MCCFFASLVFFGPRLAFLIYWLLAPLKVTAAFESFSLPWLVGIMGLLFAPWTTLMFVIVFPLMDLIGYGSVLAFLRMLPAISVVFTIARKYLITPVHKLPDTGGDY